MGSTTLALGSAFGLFTMRSLGFALLLALALPSGSALAASYQLTNGTIVDPILRVGNGELHPYSGVDLAPGADLQGADLSFADLRTAALANADLRLANLWFTQLRDADLAGANLSGSDIWQGDFSGANLTGAVWVNSSISETNLSGANLSFADLRGWYAGELQAGGASFANANLDGSFFAARLDNTDFTSASLRGVRFGTDVLQTNLVGANFFGADLTGASFEVQYLGAPGGIAISGTDFSNAILQNAIGLGNTLGAALYDSQTDFTNAWADLDATISFDPVAAGWTLVPEPGAAVLMGLGLITLSARKRRRAKANS